jgi:zona occludens toxin
MINLITGVPGSGKTAYALHFMLQQMKDDRKLFVHGIPDLKIPHVDVYCTAPNCDVCTTYTDKEKENMYPADSWHEWAPDGAVMFYDEVQNVWRPRSSGAKVPPSIQGLEVHRHKGLDFYLITQSPKLFDSNIRVLISRHIHLKQTWTGRYQYEWPECKSETQSTSDAIKSSYKLNPKMFDLYTSASLHTKQKRKIPGTVYLLIFCFIAFAGIATRTYSRFSEVMNPPQPSETINQNLGGAAVAVPQAQPKQRVVETNKTKQILDFTPALRGVLESAPAYSELVKIKSFPRIQACIAGRDKCKCYTQQMTEYPTTLEQCLDNINRQPSSFNPYLDDSQKQPTMVSKDA